MLSRGGQVHFAVGSHLEEMNDYRLKVIGLKAAQFEVRLDRVKIGDYSGIEN